MHSETHGEPLGAQAVSPTAQTPLGSSRNIWKALGTRSRARAGKIRFGITWKMFLAVLIACLTISLTMGYALRLSFENGFLHYVRARDAGRLNAVMAKVTAEYAAHGSWNFLRQHPEEWVTLLDAAHDQALRQEMVEAQTNKLPSWRTFPGSASVQQMLGPLSGKEEGPHWGMRLPAPAFADSGVAASRDRGVGRDVTFDESPYDRPPAPRPPPGRGGRGAPQPATLFDANHDLVATTDSEPPPDVALKPVIYNGKIVGWVAANAPNTLSDAADIAFQAQQARATWEIAGVAVIVAALVAMLLARIVLAPVKRLMIATHRLAGGDYTTRVAAGRRDELDRLAGDFNVLADSLQRAERSRRDFIADISHELRTPLAVLRSELEAIEDGVHAFDRHSLASLQNEVAMLNKLIEDLYELSLSDVGALSYRKVPADIGQLVRASVDAMRESFRAKQIALSLTLPEASGDGSANELANELAIESTGMVFQVDPARFVQLLKNLLLNSLRYTDPGGSVCVSVSVGPRGWQLDIQDSLPGVPAEALPHLFERLYRVDESRSRQSGGAGLGLALCRAIVTAHGGTTVARPSPLGGVWITAHFEPEGVAA
ncbi:periplasmic sensor signal transduction histidine kinase [Caballeronia udeis]|uniref:histidine kinase n=1 Tax=Caballeronia udeis TaxID=1232866 RepID=A0A158IJ70_9BURK|nr:ATP-binding protein [Caballeronia udeis]SAL56672.1 periplasmic sensor signal transduction histidine kinase [Caballeronia udeis]